METKGKNIIKRQGKVIKVKDKAQYYNSWVVKKYRKA
jgi:hypothetical protein